MNKGVKIKTNIIEQQINIVRNYSTSYGGIIMTVMAKKIPIIVKTKSRGRPIIFEKGSVIESGE